MDGLLKTTEKKVSEEEFDFKSYFVPLTNAKAITWIVIIGLVVYANMVFNGFVWDDFVDILNPTDIHTFNIAHLLGLNIFNTGGYYRGVAAIYFSLFYTLFNTQSFYYHIIQLFIHIANVCFVYLLLKKFFINKISFLLSIIFLVHPIQVETVSFIIQTQVELFLFFGMLALILEIYRKSSRSNLILQALLLLLSCLSKETGVFFILIIFLYQFLFNRKKMIIFLPYVLGIFVIYLVIRFIYAGDYFVKNITSTIGLIPFSERLISIPAVFYYYIKTFFYPANLAIDQRWIITTISLQKFYFPLLIDLIFILLLIGVGLYIHKHNKNNIKIYVFFLVWFLVGIGTLMQIIPLDMTVADRWFYFPIIGLLGIIGIVITQFKLKNIKSSRVCYIVIAFIIIVLSVRTIVRNSNFIDYETLLTHDSQVMNNYDIEYNLGALLYFEKKYPQALQHALKSYKLYPYDYSLLNIGSMYEAMGNNEKAKESYAQALAMKKSYNSPHNHYLIFYIKYICILLLYDSPNSASEQITYALKDYPNSWQLWELKALVDYKLKKNNDALATIYKTQEMYPNIETRNFYFYIRNKPPVSFRDYKNITEWILSQTSLNS